MDIFANFCSAEGTPQRSVIQCHIAQKWASLQLIPWKHFESDSPFSWKTKTKQYHKHPEFAPRPLLLFNCVCSLYIR